MKVAVLGAGAWGTALAVHVALAHPTHLWARDADQAARMRTNGCNHRYLADVGLPPALQIGADFDAAIRHAEGGLVLVATPMAGLGETLRRLPARLDAQVVWLCKGFEGGTGRLGHEIARDACPQLGTGVLSGPSFADEVARGLPAALVAASTSTPVLDAVVAGLHGGSVRIYTSSDPTGVEVGGAVKNVLAIAAGISDGMGLGLNARAALITRGLAEMTRLGVALGADAATFTGLSGLGDLVLTSTGALSRNRAVGLELAGGGALETIVAGLGHVAEGVPSAAMVLRRAHERGVEMPIVEAIVQVLDGRLAPRRALELLMRREVRAEAAPP